jgi:hypothetical protein
MNLVCPRLCGSVMRIKETKIVKNKVVYMCRCDRCNETYEIKFFSFKKIEEGVLYDKKD